MKEYEIPRFGLPCNQRCFFCGTLAIALAIPSPAPSLGAQRHLVSWLVVSILFSLPKPGGKGVSEGETVKTGRRAQHDRKAIACRQYQKDRNYIIQGPFAPNFPFFLTPLPRILEEKNVQS